MNENLRRYFYSLMTDAPAAKGPMAAALKYFLYGLSFVYASAVAIMVSLLKMGITKPYRPECKVISVGNITLGGTGKTPLTAAIARKLRDKGKRVVILTRGYMKDKEAGIADEAEFFKRSLAGVPVIIGRDRTASAKEAEAKYAPDVILLDDGFQHWRLNRDIDVVTVDVDNPFGNGRLIPRGILREPVSALGRAHLVVVTKVLPEEASLGRAEVLKGKIRDINPNAAVFNASYYPRRLYDVMGGHETGFDSVDNRPVALLCAIGDPASFEDTAVSLGAKVAATHYFMDHHIFTAGEIDKVIEECKAKRIDTVITTEKDLPRVQRSAFNVQRSGMEFLVLEIDIKIDEEEKFFDRFDSLFAGKA